MSAWGRGSKTPVLMSGADQEPAIHQSPGYWICRVSGAMRACFEQRLEELGVTLWQWAVLSSVARDQVETPSEIARWTGFDPSATTRLVSGLCERELLERVPNPEDRRSVHIVATAAGQRLVSRLVELSRRTNDEFLSPLTKAERQAFVEALQKIDRRARAEGLATDSCAAAPPSLH